MEQPTHRPPRQRRRRRSALLAIALLWSATGCGRGPAPPAERPDLLLITVDTLRPDALGWVAGSSHTPEIDRLAREGFRFPSAVAPMPLTHPTHAAMMTGFLPRRLGLRDNGQVLDGETRTLAETLRADGYATAAFVSGYPLSAIFGLDRGFDLYDDRLPTESGGELERRADATTGAALAWLESAPKPWFAWIHYYDPHYPYEPPAELLLPGWRGAYDAEVAFVDRAVGELLRGLPDSNGSRLVVFAGDHGESLGEHGEGTHGFFLYDSTVLVPLVLHFPGRIEPGESAAPARLVDLAPTVLALLGLPLPAAGDGVSLAPLLRGEPQTIPAAYMETHQPWISYGWSPLKAVRHGDWKLIVAPRPELYHLADDPGEERDLIAERPGKARELEQQLRLLEPEAATAAPASGDPEAAARLRALGYLGSGASASEPRDPRALRDPKDGKALRDLLTEADVALRRGEHESAAAGFDAVLAEDPDNRFALLRSAHALMRLGDFETSIPRLERAVALDPLQPEARLALAEALTRTGRYPAAAEHWAEAARLQPRRAATWSNLGTALGLAGRTDDAVRALERALDLEPDRPERLARLAFAEHAAGRSADAVGHLLRMAELTGLEAFPHAGALGILMVELGRGEEARAWLARSRRGEAEFAEARFRLARLEAGKRPEAARRALAEALAADPGLRQRAASDPTLARLLP